MPKQIIFDEEARPHFIFTGRFVLILSVPWRPFP